MMYPKFSIVTTSFNQAEYLEKTILSVLNQNYPNLEYIIIDGGSTDGSVSIIKEYEDKISHWCSEPDNGPAEALNKGFSFATGEIFSFINSDDIYLPGAFARVVNKFNFQKNIDVIYGNCIQLDDFGNITRKLYSNKWNFRRYIFGACNIMQQSVFFKKNIFRQVNGFNPNNHTCWDGELWAQFGLIKAKFYYLKKFIGGFRVHKGSITGSSRLNEQYLLDSRLLKEQMLENFRVPAFYNNNIATMEKFFVSPLNSIRSALTSIKESNHKSK